MDPQLPTREHPKKFGTHHIYYVEGDIPVVVYRGGVTPEEFVALIDVMGRFARRFMVTVADVGELGAFSPQARKLVVQSTVGDIMATAGTEIGVFVANADVVRRALLTLIVTAVRLVSKYKVRMYFVDSLAEAEARAVVYRNEVLAREAESTSLESSP